MTIPELAVALAKSSAHYDAACRTEDYVQQCTLRETIEAMCFFHLKQIIEILDMHCPLSATQLAVLRSSDER